MQRTCTARRLPDIIIEGDTKLCFDAIDDESNTPWSIGPLIGNIGERIVNILCLAVFVGPRRRQFMLPMLWQNLLHSLIPFPFLLVVINLSYPRLCGMRVRLMFFHFPLMNLYCLSKMINSWLSG